MNVAIKIITASIVSLVIGYNLYPLMHQNSTGQSDVVVSEVATNEATAQNATTTASEAVVTVRKSEVLNTQSSKSTFEHALTIGMNNSQVVDTQAYDEGSERSSLSSEDIRQQEALTRWSVEHQARVRGVLEEYLSSESIDSSFEYIVSGNKLLDNPMLRQSAEVDNDWATETEQIIRDLIQQHEYGFDVEILSLVCKQLTCEFIIRQTAKGSWHEIYISLLRHFVISGRSINGEEGKHMTNMTDKGSIYYAQFVFSDKSEL